MHGVLLTAPTAPAAACGVWSTRLLSIAACTAAADLLHLLLLLLLLLLCFV
jgi:hypothetical protein